MIRPYGMESLVPNRSACSKGSWVLGVNGAGAAAGGFRYDVAMRKPRLKFVQTLLIQVAIGSVFVFIAYAHHTFGVLALVPVLIATIAFGEWAAGRAVIKGWPKDRT